MGQGWGDDIFEAQGSMVGGGKWGGRGGRGGRGGWGVGKRRAAGYY